MNTNSLGILSRLPWNRYSFLRKPSLNDGILSNVLNHVLLKDSLSYNSSDVLKLLSLIGKCSCDSNLIYKTNWTNIYNSIYKSVTNSTHIWRFNSLVKLIQNASYLCYNFKRKHLDISFLTDTVRLVINKLGKTINQVSDKDISRIIYSCSKGDFLGNLLASKSFLLLLENEIIQRLNRFEAIDLLKILHSIISIRKHNEIIFEKDFISCICNKILENISKIGSIDISNFLCFLYNNNLFNSVNKSKINININKRLEQLIAHLSNPIRLYGIDDKDLLLSTSLSLTMYNIINLKNMKLIIKRLKTLDLQDEDVLVFKLMIYYLKYNTSVYEELCEEDKHYLNSILSKFINGISYGLFSHVNNFNIRSSNGKLLNINQEVHRLLKMLNYNFIPYLYGPYLLNCYDPINKIAILANFSSDSHTSNCGKSSSYGNNRWMLKNMINYNENMKRHLELEGLKVVELPHDFFSLNIYRQMHHLTSKLM